MAESMWFARTDRETGCRIVTGPYARVASFVEHNRSHVTEFRRVPK